MPRRKKRVYSTKPRKTKEAPKASLPPEPKEVDRKFTLDEAIEWFRKDPHLEDFISLDKPGSAIIHGNHYIKFKDGQYRTSDPVEVEIIMRSGLAFVPLNPILRNLKK